LCCINGGEFEWEMWTWGTGQAGVSRVVVGIRHPFEHLQGRGITALRHAGLNVDVAGEDLVDSRGNIAV
jgi:hypothetical protein